MKSAIATEVKQEILERVKKEHAKIFVWENIFVYFIISCFYEKNDTSRHYQRNRSIQGN